MSAAISMSLKNFGRPRPRSFSSRVTRNHLLLPTLLRMFWTLPDLAPASGNTPLAGPAVSVADRGASEGWSFIDVPQVLLAVGVGAADFHGLLVPGAVLS